ncbi:MAG TPA: hypothetical protein VGB22_01950 [candidate division Zixibacteria bacterium]|jgi:hypothetical protein
MVRDRLTLRAATGFLFATLLAGYMSSCGGDGNGPSGQGSVEGVVYLPFDLTAGLLPASSATVRLSGGDYSMQVVTGADGAFAFADAPARELMLTADFGSCGSAASMTIEIVADETLSQDIVLSPSDPGNCIDLPYAGAARMVVDETNNTGLLLYDTQFRPKPLLVRLDLASGEAKVAELSDVTNVFDIELVSSDLAVVNCQVGVTFGLRFFDVTTLQADGADIPYHNSQGASIIHPGRIALDASHSTVFATHAYRPGGALVGGVYAISVASRSLIDADLISGDGKPGFDNELVAGAMVWPYNVAFDPDAALAGEILVGNRQGTFVTAIDWSRWGTFNRDAGLSIPTTGVRQIEMDPDVTGFGVVFWDFAGGFGVGASAPTPILSYESGSSGSALTYTESGRDLRSGDHILTIIPERQSWFTIVYDPSSPFPDRHHAIEQRSLTTLGPIMRFNTSRSTEPPLIARAFGINATTGRIYVGYQALAVLEVFSIQ